LKNLPHKCIPKPAIIREFDDVVITAVPLGCHNHLEQRPLAHDAVNYQLTTKEPVTTMLAAEHTQLETKYSITSSRPTSDIHSSYNGHWLNLLFLVKCPQNIGLLEQDFYGQIPCC